MFDMDRFKTSTTRWATPWATRCCARWAARAATALRRRPTSWRAWAATSSRCCCHGADADARQASRAKILKALEAPLVVDGQTMDIAASIGIARFPEHGEDAQALMRAADVAMYAAKRGKTATRSTTRDHDSASRSTSRCWANCAARWSATSCVLHYQPKMRLARPQGERRRGAGALAPPDARLRAAGASSSRSPSRPATSARSRAGCCDEAIAPVRRVAPRGAGTCSVGEHLGARPATRSLPEHVSRRCSPRTRCRPALLCLEITESGLMDDPARAQPTLRRLRDAGRRDCRSTTTAPATRRWPTSSSCRSRAEDRPQRSC